MRGCNEYRGLVCVFYLDLAPPGRDNKLMHVFRLSDFEGDGAASLPLGRSELKEHRLERTRGCHLYAVSRPGGSHLRVVVAIKNKLLVMQWRHSAAWTAWCPASDTDTVEGFQNLRVSSESGGFRGFRASLS